MASPVEYVYCTDPEEFELAVSRWHARPPKILGLDFETSSLDPKNGFIVLVQLSDGTHTVVAHAFSCAEALVDGLEPILTNPEVRVLAHNAKFEYQWAKVQLGIEIAQLWDTWVMDGLLRAGLEDAKDEKSGKLDACVKRWLKKDLDKALQTSFVGVEPTFVPTQEQLDYAALDARTLIPLYHELFIRLDREDLLDTMRLEARLTPVLAEMELRGAAVDKPGWEALVEELQTEMAKSEETLKALLSPALATVHKERYAAAVLARQYWEERKAQAKAHFEELAGPPIGHKTVKPEGIKFKTDRERRTWINEQMKGWLEANPQVAKPKTLPDHINLQAPGQLKDALWELGIQVPNTEGKTLDEARYEFPQHCDMLQILCRWKALQTLSKTFGQKMVDRIGPDGRLHPEFNQMVSTGRMSCRKPNLQNIPKGSKPSPVKEEAQRFRKVFIAPPGRKLVCADYSAIEFVIAADMYDEELIIAELMKGEEGDPHKATWATVQELMTGHRPSFEEIGKSDRDIAKIVNYGRMYGVGPTKISVDCKIPLDHARKTLKAIEQAQPNITEGLRKSGELALSQGYTLTALGRRRHYSIPPVPIMGPDEDYRQTIASIKRQGMNAPIQGTSADIIKWALVRLHEALRGSRLDAFITNCVHDEIIVECEEKQAELVKKIMEVEMVRAAKEWIKKAPIVVKPKISEVWEH